MAETEIEKEPSVLDDVRAAMLENAGEPNAEAPAERVPAPAANTGTEAVSSEGAAQRARDEAGRFAKAEEGKAKRETLTVKDPGVAAVVKEEIAATGEAKTPDERHKAPPATWKGAARVQWDKLPLPAREEIHDEHKAVAAERAEYQPLLEAITPYKEAWVRDAGSLPAAINQLGQFYQLFLTNPAGLIQHIARTTGIQLGQPTGQPATGAGSPQAPDLASFIEQAVQQRIAPVLDRFAQTENQQLQSTIDAFGGDPKHPYFQDVKVHMGRLIQAGAAKDLQDAYDQATWANPVIRQQLLEQQTEATKQTQAAAVAKARAAGAISVRGSPLPGVNGSGGAGAGASVLDDVRAAAAELSGA